MKILILIVFISITLFSCDNTQKDLLLNVTGKPGEIVVVIEKNTWSMSPGEQLKRILTTVQPALPQDEPMFRVYHIEPSNFSVLFKSNRNIIYVEKGDFKDSATIHLKYDVWAKPQAYIEISAPSDSELTTLIMNNEDKIIDFFITSERKRMQATYNTFKEKEITSKLLKHHVNLTFPKGYKIDVDTLGFVWITSETPNISQGVFIYEYNYRETNTFTAKYIIQKRDSVLKRFVPGQLPETYMTTEHGYVPYVNEIFINGKYTFELRSLWKVQNDFMGGPFVSLSTVDKKRNKVITVEGYVYAPKYDKLEYVRQIEAILYTLEVVN